MAGVSERLVDESVDRLVETVADPGAETADAGGPDRDRDAPDVDGEGAGGSHRPP